MFAFATPVLVSVGLVALVATGIGSPQPLSTERKGVSNVQTAVVDLTSTFDMKQGRTLRMRRITLAPGGVLPMHAHVDRPSVSYVLSGTLTEIREDDEQPHIVTAGQSYSSFRTGHALLNRGRKPVVFLEVDLPSTPR